MWLQIPADLLDCCKSQLSTKTCCKRQFTRGHACLHLYVCQVKKVSFVECIDAAQSELEHARTVNSLPHLNIAALAGGGEESEGGGGGARGGGGGVL